MLFTFALMPLLFSSAQVHSFPSNRKQERSEISVPKSASRSSGKNILVIVVSNYYNYCYYKELITMQQVKSTMGGVMPNTAIPGASASGSLWHRGHTWGRLLLLCAQTAGTPAQHLGLKHHLNQSRERKEWCMPPQDPPAGMQASSRGRDAPHSNVAGQKEWDRPACPQNSLIFVQPHCAKPRPPCSHQALHCKASWHTSLHSLLSLTLNLAHRSRAGGTWRSL